jgi:O-antigen/teichoic acid export membrane protein
MWLLYDQRYAESGNMLRILAMGGLISVVGSSYNGLLWAKGMLRVSTSVLAILIVFQVAGMFVGYHFLGEKGVVLSAAVVSWLLYPVDAYVHARIGLWEPKIDLPFIALSILVVALNFKGIFNHV